MKRTRSFGFTLIELMITVAIIAVIAAFAYPSYQEHVRKARRSDAKSALTNAAALQERWFTEHNSYTNTISNVGGSSSSEGFYTISITGQGSCVSGAYISCYTLTATATGTQSSDTKCATMSLNNLGEKTSTGGGTDCW